MKVTASRKQELVAKLSNLQQKIADLVRTSEATKETALEALKFALSTTRDVADACNFAPLKGSVSVLLEVLERIELSVDVHDDLIAILKRLEKMLEVFNRYLDSQQEQRVMDFMASLTSTVDAVRASIETKLRRGRVKRFLLARKDAEDVVRLLRVVGDTAESFSMNIDVETAAKVQQVLTRLKLLELPFIEKAQYQAILNTGCTPGTRAGITGDLLKWSTLAEYDEQPVCWLRGQAGAGKTTIMCTMSRILERSGILGGTFFCSRDAADRRTITNIFPTIAQSLATALPGFQDALLAALNGKKGVGSFTPDQQFEILIAQPARAALDKSKSPWPIRVVVIDALDECDNDGAIIHMFLDILSKHASGLGIRFLVASRPELQFIHSFSGGDKTWSHVIHMQDIPEKTAQADVLTFLKSERTRCIDTSPKREWPTERRLERLASRSGSLFVYASTVWRYISDIHTFNPSERLEEILDLPSDPSEQLIDSMYRHVLSGLWNKQRSESDLNVTTRCLQATICLFEPLSIQDLSLFLGVSSSLVQAVLDSLHSVIRVPPLNENGPVTIFHASFANYLLDPARSGGKSWHIDVMASHRELCLRSWQIMKTKLHFNISGSRSSYLSNEEQDRLRLPGALVYACLRWIDHFAEFQPCLADMQELQVSFSARFLFWLEVLSVSKHVQEGQRTLVLLTQCMRKLLTGAPSRDEKVPGSWIEDEDAAQATMHSFEVDVARLEQSATNIERLASEGRKLLIAFSTPIATSAPHIYISALACTNHRTVVQPFMGGHFWNLPNVSTKQARQILPLLNLVGHDGTINSVAFSPDGKRIASGSVDRTIRMWNTDTGTQVGEPLRGHRGSVNSVAFAPDGKRIASGSGDRTIRMWDTDTGTQVGEPLRGHGCAVYSVAFSPDGRHIASGLDDDTIRMWDIDTGIQVGESLRGHYGRVRSLAFSPDGKHIASGSDDHTIQIWDTNSGTQAGEPLRGHQDRVHSAAFSPDGKHIASGSDDHTIRIWDTDTGTQVGKPLRGHRGTVLSVAFSPNGTRIASGSYDDTIQMWDPDTGRQIGEPLHAYGGMVHSIAFSPDGKHIASGSDDHTIRMWDIDTGTQVGKPLRGHRGRVYSVASLSGGKCIASGSHDDTIRMRDTDTGTQVGEPLRGHGDTVHSVAFSPDGKHIVSGSDDHTIRMWDTDTGTQIGEPLHGHSGTVYSVAFSPDGKHIASGSDNGTIRMWRTDTGTQVGEPLRGHRRTVDSVAFSPDGKRIASGSSDDTIRMWDTDTGTQVGEPLRGHRGTVFSVAFSPDGKRIASGSSDETIRMWDTDTGIQVGEPLRGHSGAVCSVAFLPDGKRIASGSFDKTIRMWDTDTGTQVGEPLRGHSGEVWSVAFLPDGKRIASGSSDDTIRMWDTDTGTQVGEPLRGHDSMVYSVAFSPHGKRIASGSGDHTIRMWDTDTGAQVGEPLRSQGHIVSSCGIKINFDGGETADDPAAHHPVPIHDPTASVLAARYQSLSASAPFHRPMLPAFPRCAAYNFGLNIHPACPLDRDGWLRGPNGEFIFWVLPEYRRGLLWPGNTMVFGIHPVRLDFRGCSLGEDWTKCYQYRQLNSSNTENNFNLEHFLGPS